MPRGLSTQLCLTLLCTLLLAGCSNLGDRPEAEQGGAVGESPQEEAAGDEAEESAAEEPEPLIARNSVDEDVRNLLAAAEAALAADKLTTPLHDNAFDRFQAVLLLRPNNEQAKSGLQQILARYVGMIRSALARNDPEAARLLVHRAKLIDFEHPVWAELGADIEALEARLARNAGPAAKGKEIALDAQGLERRSEAMIETLQSLARQIKDSQEALLIVARNDAEGRWIYQRMNEGVPDYRLRGDIQIGRQPKIVLMPPLE